MSEVTPHAVKVVVVPQDEHLAGASEKYREGRDGLGLHGLVRLQNAELVDPQTRRPAAACDRLTEEEHNEKDGHGQVDNERHDPWVTTQAS